MTAIAGIRAEKIDRIIQSACAYYGAERDAVCMSVKGTQPFRWKRYLIVILYDYTDLNLTEILNVLGYKSYTNLHYGYKKLKDELSDEIYGSAKVKLSYNELLKHLGLYGEK